MLPNLAALPFDVLLAIINHLPDIVLTKPRHSRIEYLADWQTRHALCLVNKRVHRGLTPVLWSSDRLVVTPDNVEAFLLAAASSRTFGSRLGRDVSSLTVTSFPSQGTDTPDRLPAARRAVRVATRADSLASSADMSTASAPQDLLWMVLAACPSPATLKLDAVHFAYLVSLSTRSRFLMPSCWDRLLELDLTLAVRTKPSPPSSLLDLLGECPETPVLRKLTVRLQDGNHTEPRCTVPPATVPPDLSTVQELEIVQHKFSDPTLTSALLEDLLAACRPQHLASEADNGWFAERLGGVLPSSVSTLVLRGWLGWVTFERLCATPRRADSSLHRVVIDGVRHRLGSASDICIPEGLQELHLCGAPPERLGGIDWTHPDALERRAALDTDVEPALYTEVHRLLDPLHHLGEVLDRLSRRSAPHTTIYLDSSVHNAPDRAAATADVVKLKPPDLPPGDDLVPPDMQAHYWVAIKTFALLLVRLSRLAVQRDVRVLIPSKSIMILILNHPAIFERGGPPPSYDNASSAAAATESNGQRIPSYSALGSISVTEHSEALGQGQAEEQEDSTSGVKGEEQGSSMSGAEEDGVSRDGSAESEDDAAWVVV